MKMLFIGALVAAELVMVAGALPRTSGAGTLIGRPPAVDGAWAKAMARKADREARQDARAASRRRALNACLGPDRESFSPTRYEARAKACEAQMAGAAAAARPTAPSETEYPKPAETAPVDIAG